MNVLTAAQMRDFDHDATEEYGIPSIVLMENAALRVVEFLEAKFAPLHIKKIVVLCGKGNNGGDGLAIARHLLRAGGHFPLFVIHASAGSYSGDAAINFRALERMAEYPGDSRIELCDYESFKLPKDEFQDIEETGLTAFIEKTKEHLARADIAIDALLGTGATGQVRFVTEFLRASMRRIPVRVAVDIPSGLDANTGEFIPNFWELKETIAATHTVTFAAPKPGLFVRAGVEMGGELWVGDIGTLPSQLENAESETSLNGLEWAKRLLPKRSRDAHKGDAGRALIIGGSFGMTGAIALASRAALASGVGLCIAAMPEKALPIFASAVLEPTSHPLPGDERGRFLEKAADELPELWKNVQVVALGPGLGRSDETFDFVRRVVRECPQPLIIDADALHALPEIADEVKSRNATTILTPHPGEMGTLMGTSASEVNDDRYSVVRECAKKYGAITVLKGAYSLIAEPNGLTRINLSGNPGMATGGSGDVLTGTLAGLLAQLKDAKAATQLGVYLHGYAGDMAARTLGNGLVAGDIAAHLPMALQEIATREPERINARLRKVE